MRAHEMTELLSVGASLAMFLLSRRRSSAALSGEQTGGRRFGAMKLSRADRARLGLALPSERDCSGRSPPGVL